MARNTDTPRVLPNFLDALEGTFVPPPPRTIPPPPRSAMIPPPPPTRSPTPRAPEYSAARPPSANRSTPPPPPPIKSNSPPPPLSANFRDVGGARRSSFSDRVDIRDLLSRPPEIIEFDQPPEQVEAAAPKFHSVAPVSMSSIHLEDLPEPTRRNSRLAYTTIVAVALVAAVYVYRMQPVRTVATAAAQAAPGFENPLGGAFKNEPPAADKTPTTAALPEAVVLVDPVQYAPTATATSNRVADNHGAAAKKTDKERESTSKDEPKAEASAAAPPAAAEEETAPAPPVDTLPEFSPSQAQAALSTAAGSASSCLGAGDPSATVRVAVTFAPSGSATNSWIEGPPFAGTPQGGCIAKVFRGAHINAFSGGLITVRKTFQIR